MDEEWKQTMNDFNHVWPRVNGMGPPPPPPSKPEQGPGPGAPPSPPQPPKPEHRDTVELAKLIRMESEAEQRYRAMAARTKGKASQTLDRLAAGSRRIIKRLQAEYYLRTGDTLPVPRERFRSRGMQEDLRRAWLDAREGEKAYLNAAANTRDPELRSLYGDAAEQKQHQQRELRALARRVIG